MLLVLTMMVKQKRIWAQFQHRLMVPVKVLELVEQHHGPNGHHVQLHVELEFQ